MKLDTLIQVLSDFRTQHGNLECIDTEGNDDFTLEVQGQELILCDKA